MFSDPFVNLHANALLGHPDGNVVEIVSKRT